MPADPAVNPMGEEGSRPNAAENKLATYRIELRGRVQGIGYRPELARLASELNVRGTVSNTASGLAVHVVGDEAAVGKFLVRCPLVCPPEGQVVARFVEPVDAFLATDFRILEDGSRGPLGTPVPLDRTTCSECLRESRDSKNRRFGYSLITCSRCGPRYSLLDQMPYERHWTTMSDYPLCQVCQREYESPADRRYHAQTTSCPSCGPQVVNLESGIAQLLAGQVVGLKGVGGYQLLAAVDCPAALKRLRTIKQRLAKPLAIMVADASEATKFGQLCNASIAQLCSPGGPIVIVPQICPPTHPTDCINPGLRSLGLMLPTTALHAQLVVEVGPLVVTSANIEGDPLVYQDTDLPAWLTLDVPTLISHDRPIRRPIDDSVVRVSAGQAVTIRNGRGLAPLELDLGEVLLGQQVLAVGGQQKVAVALCNGKMAVLGPHLGDMDSLSARQRFDEQVRDLLNLFDCEPTMVIHDLHPDYFTTRWAQQFAQDRHISAIAIPHHMAHAASSLIEPKWIKENVAAVTWDGTGYGQDHTIWGGEGFVYLDAVYRRVCRLRPFSLPGGEMAVRQPWRILVGLLRLLSELDSSFRFRIDQPFSIDQLLDSKISGPRTSSIGRLFDAAAVLIMGKTLPTWEVEYEGQFAALLEAHADPTEQNAYPFPLEPHQAVDLGEASPLLEWNWEPLIRSIIADRLAQVPSRVMAMRFHRSLAAAIESFATAVGLKSLSLSGGVFQNGLLSELVASRFHNHSIHLALPGRIPVNDGGLAAGQLLVALQQFSRGDLREHGLTTI